LDNFTRLQVIKNEAAILALEIPGPLDFGGSDSKRATNRDEQQTKNQFVHKSGSGESVR
jgi:hypothetical protein